MRTLSPFRGHVLFVSRSFFAAAAVILVVSWCRVAAPANAPVVLRLQQDTEEIDPQALRDAVARELGAVVLSDADASAATVTLAVTVDQEHGLLVVSRSGSSGTIERKVPLPADPSETFRTAVFLIGNLARDEASEVLGELRSPPPPTAKAPAEGAPPPLVSPTAKAPDEPRPPARRRLWAGVSLEGDVAFVPSATNVCSTQGSEACVNTDGTDFPGTNQADMALIQPGRADQIQGGAAPANLRFLAAVDYVIQPSLLLGGRLGVATPTYPGNRSAFGHLHVEVRVTVLFGDELFVSKGLSAAIVLAGGVAEHSAPTSVQVFRTSDPITAPGTTFTAWRLAGPGFAAGGLGVRWTPVSNYAISVLPAKMTLAFGGSYEPLVLYSPEVTAQVGF